MPFTRLGPDVPTLDDIAFPKEDVRLKPPVEPVYLGDGAYASFDGHQFCVYADNGVTITNQVYLELPAIRALNDYVARVRGEKDG